MNKSKPYIFITARLKSQRLKKKIIMPFGDLNVITFLIKRLSLVFEKKKIILITSNLTQDNPLVKISINTGIKYFRGDPIDVLKRMSAAAKKFKVNNFISCTADNPFLDPYYSIKLYNFHIKHKFDMSMIQKKKLPLGVFSYVINSYALQQVIKFKNSADTEIWADYFLKNKFFKCGIFKKIKKCHTRKDIRLTIDYLEDYIFLQNILALSGSKIPSLDIIFDIIDKYSFLKLINKKCKQKIARKIDIKDEYKNYYKI